MEAFRAERASFHEDPGEVGAILAGLAELGVPGTACEFDFDGLDTLTA